MPPSIARIIGIISCYDKLCRKSICQVHSCHMVHGLHRETVIVIQEIATPSLERSTGCYRTKVGECYLFSVKLDFEKAKEYRKSYGAYLRHNQWNDIEVEVCMLI